MLVTGLGPTSERVDGRVQAWTRLALDSFKGTNPVWRATGHNEPVDGRVQTWTRQRRAIIPRTDGQRPKDRSVIFNPQGWETVFNRYPGRRPWSLVAPIGYLAVSLSSLLVWLPSRSTTSTSSGALRRLLTLCTSGYIW